MRWALKEVGWFLFDGPGSTRLSAKFCEPGTSAVDENAPFYQQAGVLTFLKTSIQLQIWFNDLLEVTWVYEDDGGTCHMRKQMKGLRFSSNSDIYKDTVSTHYRSQIGSYDCSIIFIISYPSNGRIIFLFF